MKRALNFMNKKLPSTVPLTGLIYYYKLDVNSNDNYGSNNAISSVGVTYSAGKVGNAAFFSGAGNSNIVYNFSGIITTKASISFWIKLTNHTPTVASKTGIIYTNTGSAVSHYPFIDGNIYCSILTGTRKSVGTGIIANRTQWHMITVTADTVANVWKFYQNGTLVMTSTVGTLTMRSTDGTFGKSEAAVYLDGAIDEVAIYNIALTQAEINSLYNSGSGTTL